MDELNFWQYKIYQAFHDPPGKPLAGFPRMGGHKKLAKSLFKEFTKQAVKKLYFDPRPDFATAGADRPMLSIPWVKGLKPVRILWWNRPLLTHPLARGPLFLAASLEELDEAKRKLKQRHLITIDRKIERQYATVEELAIDAPEWTDSQALKQAFVRLWRRFREDLATRSKSGRVDLLWEEMPADTRVPDHSIWDHVRMTTALAFLQGKAEGDELTPWLLRFSIGPVQDFILESRKARDLWISSFILSDLVWHAMEPFIEQYGPDCIVYPDLRGNARADCWLAMNPGPYPKALPIHLDDTPGTFAALIPNTFTVIVPQGSSVGHAKPLEELAARAAARVEDHWEKLSDMVKSWLIKRIMEEGKEEFLPAIERIWPRQQKRVFYTTWTAVPWLPMEPLKLPEGARVAPEDFLLERALPAQRPDFRPVTAQDNQAAMRARAARLAPWVPHEAWSRYEWARKVFARTNLHMLQLERGFDYALTHHQLSVRHTMTRQTSRQDLDWEEHGEKCTLCGKRQALAAKAIPKDQIGDGVDNDRQAAGRFWEWFDRDREGRERLCGVCTVKRYLVEADGVGGNFNRLWAGINARKGDYMDDDGVVRVPFPSTATIAAQEFLEQVAKAPQLEKDIEAIISLCEDKASGMPARYKTAFPRALPRLAALTTDRGAGSLTERFFRIETQVLFPETVESERRRVEALLTSQNRPKGHRGTRSLPANPELPHKLEKLRKASEKLRQAAKESGIKAPGTRYAVVQMDGDAMHRLLLGDKDAIHARWRDVLHPGVVKETELHPHLGKAGWSDLVDAPRLMGPSLHAFISRAQGDFSNVIAPWVVEQEYSGRLIYAGGDDLLALVPSDEAIYVAARLQQLFSAAWVIDTDFLRNNWDWRQRKWTGTYDTETARKRFRIPRSENEEPIQLPETLVEAHVSESAEERTTEKQYVAKNGRTFRMLGPYCSLSAGIAYAHFKTSLSLTMKEARRLLSEVAKEKLGRRAVAMSYFSRNGVKASFGLRWSDPGQEVTAQRLLSQVQLAFRSGALARRLPYKLREVAPSAAIVLLSAEKQFPDVPSGVVAEKKSQVLAGFVRQALEGPSRKDDELISNVVQIWQGGFDLNPDEPDRSVEGLLLCRALSGAEGEERE